MSRPSSSSLTQSLASRTLAATSILAFIFIYLLPPSSKTLFDAFMQVRQTGTYPDGLSVRRTYTGIPPLDEMFTGLAGFFSAATDGRDNATHLFCLWFLPQLVGVLVFIYWEAGKARQGLIRFPTVFGVLAQLFTAGVTLPLYYIVHMRTIPGTDSILPSDSLNRAQTLLPAIVLGYLLPSAILFLTPPQSVSLDTRQILAAVWQPFPIYIAVLHTSLQHIRAAVRSRVKRSNVEEELSTEAEALKWVKYAYGFSAAISAVAHWAIVIPSLFSSDPSHSFAHVFVPYILHDQLLLDITPLSLPAYRLTIRLLFQHDWLFMTIAAFIFFAWHRSAVTHDAAKKYDTASWLVRLLLVTLVGGPGATFALEAVEREGMAWDGVMAKASKERIGYLEKM